MSDAQNTYTPANFPDSSGPPLTNTQVASGHLVSPRGDVVSTVGKRFGQYLLDGLLMIATLGIGYLIWSLIIWSKGQTPGMQCLGMRCVKQDTGETASEQLHLASLHLSCCSCSVGTAIDRNCGTKSPAQLSSITDSAFLVSPEG